jgi:hypothetical protein
MTVAEHFAAPMTRLSDLIRPKPTRGLSVPRWLERLASVGIVTSDPEIARLQRITNIGAFLVAGTALSYLAINALHNFSGLITVHELNATWALLVIINGR